MDTPLTMAARVAAEPDPARRFTLARAAADAAAATAAAPYESVATEAMEQLIADHGDNVAAAAREVGLTPQALHKRRAKESGTVRPRPDAATQVQPALSFDSPEAARDALLDWALRLQDILDQRDALLLGALAAGVDPVAIAEDSGEGLDTLRRIRPAGNIAVSPLDVYGEQIEEFARAVHAKAKALGDSAGNKAERSAATVWRFAAKEIVTNAAPYALMDDAPSLDRSDYATDEEYVDASPPAPEEKDEPEPSELATVSGPDAWLAATFLSYRRQAAIEPWAPVDAEHEAEMELEDAASLRASGEAVRQAFSDLADAILHLRTTGQVPPALATEAS
ncbi:hypothetical protein AB0C52_24820 [Streptomyces sp. NPDC048717]|uniref:hypothetical protein n=1 Tax=Streptomyces sp. NPDC048717 TaxID=3154928 RepID=UPI00342E87E8